MKSYIEAFLHRHEVDLGRCLAVLWFAAAAASLYGCVFGTLFLGIWNLQGWGWMFMGIAAGKGVIAYLEFLLARALWTHREMARRIVLWMSSVLLLVLAIAPVVTPFLEPYLVEGSGVRFYATGLYEQILVPILLLPPILALWLALQTRKVRKEFGA